MGKWFGLLAIGFWMPAHAQDCYRVVMESPLADQLESQGETWCQESVSLDGQPYRLIYNFDQDLRPELSFLYSTAPGKESGRVSYGSLKKGEVDYLVGLTKDFDPLPPAVKEQLIDENKVSPRGFSSKTKKKIISQLLQKLQSKAHFSNGYQLEEGRYSYSVPRSAYPYRGYWWPTRKLEMANSEKAPLQIFDAVVPSVFPGRSSSAAAWERRYHAHQLRWGGHCNGWAAASILSKEPKAPLYDARTGLTISVSTQKAWLIETHFCVSNAFYGRRYRRSGDDPKDMSPVQFHKALIQYIQKQKKPVVLDIKPLEDVDNNVVSGFTARVRKSGRNKYKVRMSLQMHDYDSRRSNSVGAASTYSKTYKYTLTTDSRGKIVSGKWTSRSNPDFLWVPLAQSQCGGENPHVTHSLVSGLLSRLPQR